MEEDGSWVFGLKNGLYCRYFFLEKRDKATLMPIVLRKVQAGSVIHSEEWPAYSNLNRYYTRSTVNQQQNYVQPQEGTHAQNIERLWLEGKIKSLKKISGVLLETLQSYLDFLCWRF